MASQLDEDEERYQKMLRNDREDNENFDLEEDEEENRNAGEEEEGTSQPAPEDMQEGQNNQNDGEDEEEENDTDDPILRFNRETQRERNRIVNEQLANKRARRQQINQESRQVQQEAIGPIRKVYHHTQKEMKRGKWSWHGLNTFNDQIISAMIKQHKGYSKTLYRQRFDDSQAIKRNHFYHEKKERLFQLVSCCSINFHENKKK